MNYDKNIDMKNDNIIEIVDAQCITNGTLEQLENIQHPNEIGKIINKNTKEKVSEITPLIMIINQNAFNVQEKINALLNAGANPDLEISYYNHTKCTARKLCADYFP